MAMSMMSKDSSTTDDSFTLRLSQFCLSFDSKRTAAFSYYDLRWPTTLDNMVKCHNDQCSEIFLKNSGNNEAVSLFEAC